MDEWTTARFFAAFGLAGLMAISIWIAVCNVRWVGRIASRCRRAHAPAPPKQSRCYIAGPMTGIEDLNFPAFRRAALRLRTAGYYVVSPAELNPDPAMRWEDAMRADIPELCGCDVIALLPGWENSRGARIEKLIADALKLRVIVLNGAQASGQVMHVPEHEPAA
jgi:hypothetical protein